MPSAPAAAFGWIQLTTQQVTDWTAIRTAYPNDNWLPIQKDDFDVWWVSIEFLDPSRVLTGWNLYSTWATPIWEDLVENGGGTFTPPTITPPDI